MSLVIVPAGSVPLGYPEYNPQVLTDRPIPILADYIDELTGDVSHPLRSRTPVDGMIIETLRVERDTGEAVRTVGTRLREIRNVDDQAPTEAKARVREGFEEMVTASLIQVLAIDVQEGQTGDSLVLKADIKDLTIQPGDAKRSYAVKRGA